MLCGCTTTATRSYGTSYSQCASMTSRPLFMRVAESIVILAPMCQVGWARASAGRTFDRSAGPSRNGPPDAVRMSRATSPGCSPARHCQIAECSRIDRPQPSQRAGLGVPRRVDGRGGRPPPGERHDQVTARHQRLLVGRRDDLARGQRRQRGGQADHAACGDKDQVHILARRQREQRVRPLLAVDAGRQLDGRRIPHGHRLRPEPVGLGKQRRRVATTGEGHDLETLGERAQHLERLPADRTGRTEHRDPPGLGRLPCPSGRHPAPA